ncbi:MAG TPA: hypothetical protein DCZ69_14055 [Syntrophobacteraceae bacterium]|nr:hypothetical protein [Syntrophobacteraceae bacterium]
MTSRPQTPDVYILVPSSRFWLLLLSRYHLSRYCGDQIALISKILATQAGNVRFRLLPFEKGIGEGYLQER